MPSLILSLAATLLLLLALLAISNRGLVALTFLGFLTVALPLALWIAGAIALGFLLGLWLLGLFHLAQRRPLPSPKGRRGAYQAKDYGPEDFAVVNEDYVVQGDYGVGDRSSRDRPAQEDYRTPAYGATAYKEAVYEEAVYGSDAIQEDAVDLGPRSFVPEAQEPTDLPRDWPTDWADDYREQWNEEELRPLDPLPVERDSYSRAPKRWLANPMEETQVDGKQAQFYEPDAQPYEEAPYHEADWSQGDRAPTSSNTTDSRTPSNPPDPTNDAVYDANYRILPTPDRFDGDRFDERGRGDRASQASRRQTSRPSQSNDPSEGDWGNDWGDIDQDLDW